MTFKILILGLASVNCFSNYVINKRVKPTIKKIYMLDKPTEIIQSIGKKGLGIEWTYNDLINNLGKHNVDAATITDTNNLVVIDKNYNDIVTSDNLHLIKSIPSLTESIVNKLIENHINFDIFNVQQNTNFLSNIPFPLQLVGIYIIINLLSNFIVRNQFQNGFGGFKMNKDNDDLVLGKDIDTKFDDVAGCDETKYELMEIVDFLKNPKQFEESGAKIPSGVLLEGSPGTGKTLLARAVAGEAGVSFLSASGSEFIEMFVGVGAARVRKLFENAKKQSPCVIFIDEIDAVGRQRGTGFNSGNDEREQTLNQILTNMDGFDKSTGIIVLAATNRADILDSALTRPGRFDRKITVPLPDTDGRKKIMLVHLRDKKYDDKLDLDELAILTGGFSGADLSNMINEAAIFSVRYNKTFIDKKCVIDAFEKITIGLPKAIENREKEVIDLVAYHEAGHTLLACLFDDFFDVRKVTINSNQNGAGGYTLFTPKERYAGYPTKKYMLARLMVSLGGRAAEVVLYNRRNNNLSDNYEDDKLFDNIQNLDITTGASNDLKQANSIARNYINLFGINDELGLYDDSNSNQPFLGRDIAMNNNKISDYARSKVDQEVEKLINFTFKKTIDVIRNNEDTFDKIAELLIENYTIDAVELNELNFIYK